jgi:hypothetical protein
MHTIETALELVAVMLLAVLGRAVFLYLRPYRECRWTRRLGAKRVHKVKLSLHQAWEERR